jgi:protein phosphatase
LVQVAAQTDVGCQRQNNEDSFAYDAELGIFAVSDGMGGSAGGEIASQVAVEQLLSVFAELRHVDGSEHALADALYHAIGRANAAVYDRAQANPALRGMGATLVALAVQGSSAVIANIGDSRAYLLRHGVATQITLDHSLVAEQVRAGVMRAEDAASSPMQSAITRAVGTEPEVEADLFASDLMPGDRILLASDGLTRYVLDEEIARVAESRPDPQSTCAELIAIARSRGGADNITCLAVLWETHD